MEMSKEGYLSLEGVSISSLDREEEGRTTSPLE